MKNKIKQTKIKYVKDTINRIDKKKKGKNNTIKNRNIKWKNIEN